MKTPKKVTSDVTTPSPALLAAMEVDQPNSPDKDARFALFRKKLGEFRDLKFEKKHLEERLKEVNVSIEEFKHKTIPDMMDDLGIAAQTLEAEGNLPRGEVEVKPFYRANIPAEWDPEKRREAFSYLDEIGEGELIKTHVVVEFPREDRKKALDYAKRVEKAGFRPAIKEAVHHGTLTAWLKSVAESRTPLMVHKGKVLEKLDLEKVGATLGRIADFKEKDK